MPQNPPVCAGQRLQAHAVLLAEPPPLAAEHCLPGHIAGLVRLRRRVLNKHMTRPPAVFSTHRPRPMLYATLWLRTQLQWNEEIRTHNMSAIKSDHNNIYP